jgi:hypothetical protein
MAPLSEWLQIMLAEIARKRDDVERALEEEAKRAAELPADVNQRTPPEPRIAQR